ncbi:uncharacterized protein PV07_08492 [Cladophialophora immunda]|uniref:Uncharacterized protein n=1 Tax=Cladophialophora immunda TaxID=569365 RepID=A0A0D2CP25_9EURO|nr:uncharacterized protein PV07_08492 [Cladophialophora immunda]KIW25304.1 hypothetical protein PV07_08492 [Cladophialophora immunda]
MFKDAPCLRVIVLELMANAHYSLFCRKWSVQPFWTMAHAFHGSDAIKPDPNEASAPAWEAHKTKTTSVESTGQRSSRSCLDSRSSLYSKRICHHLSTFLDFGGSIPSTVSSVRKKVNSIDKAMLASCPSSSASSSK